MNPTLSLTNFPTVNLASSKTSAQQRIEEIKLKIKELSEVKKYTKEIKNQLAKLESELKSETRFLEDIDKMLIFKPGDWVQNGSPRPGEIIQLRIVGKIPEVQVRWWGDRISVPESPRRLTIIPNEMMEYLWTGEDFPKLIRKQDRFECEDIELLEKEYQLAVAESKQRQAAYCKKRIQLLTKNHDTKLNTIFKFCKTFKPEIKFVSISDIRRDRKTFSRVSLNHEIVTEYAEAIKNGDNFPPIKLKYDNKNYWLFDGFHTIEAAYSIGLTEIKAEVTEGTLRDAILESVGVNAKHGLRRSNADKRKAVTTLLTDEEWSHWSNREIAKYCKVSHTFVNKLRESLTGNISSGNQENDKAIITGNVSSDNLITYKDKHGNTSLMNTKNIGQSTTNKEVENNLDKNNEIVPANKQDNVRAKLDNNNNHNHNLNPTMTNLRSIKENEIVIVSPIYKTDDRLTLYKGSYARVTAVHEYSVDLQIWDKKITTVAITDLEPLKDGMVNIKTSLHESYYSRLMEKFGSINAVFMSAIEQC